MNCAHGRMVGVFHLTRFENEAGVVDNYLAQVTVSCDLCRKPFRFMGLPAGLDLRGASVSPDGTEARLAILPVAGD